MAVLKFSKKKKVIKKAKAKPKKAIKKTIKRKLLKRKQIRPVLKKKSVKSLKIKKTVKTKKVILAQYAPAANEEYIGKVTHYFSKVQAAVIEIKKGGLNLGDKLHFKGHTSDFTQIISSMQIEHSPINTAKTGDDIGLRVDSRVRAGDNVYLIKG